MAPKRGKQWARGPKPRAGGGLPTPRDFSSSNLSALFSQGFTMRDEARNTASHQSSWGQDARLRQKPVTFISAGFTEPLKDIKSMDDPDVVTGIDPDIAEDIDPSAHIPDQIPADVDLLDTGLSGATPNVDIDYEAPTESSEIPADHEPTIDVNIQASAGVLDNDPPPPLGFFFDLEGDKSLRAPGPKVTVPVRSHSPARSDSSEEIILFKGRSGQAQRAVLRPESQEQPTNPPSGKPHHKESSSTVNQGLGFGKTVAPSRSLKRRSEAEPGDLDSLLFAQENTDEEEDAILADYIENMAAQAGDDSESQPDGVFSTCRDLGGNHHALSLGLEDEDEIMAVDGFPDYDSIDGSSSDAEKNQNGDGDTSDNEIASGVDDESLARLLAKQDELGMGTDKLVLHDDSLGASKLRSRGGGQSSRLTPVNIGSVADDLQGLDLTDWNQSNIRKSGKARRSKQPPTFNVSDSELEVALRAAWQTDRERKKKRKLEREQLRSEGLLGKNVNPDDPRVKYQTHMVLEDIKAEIASFLLGSAETIQFPPLDNDARRIVHELARKFNIKSKSTGKGDQRRPVLYRTKHTTRYHESSAGQARNHVEMASLKIRRQHFHRLDYKGPAIPKASGGKRSGGGHKAVTYREGEIVGASAPQLGQDNKGHAMLEKMGWSRGMALGTLENKGILEPVSQVVKRSKAGLG